MRNRGPIHLARIRGIDLGLHWSWFLVALIEIQLRSGVYTFIGWNILEYLTLFLIVTVHEYGHALACRSVGGAADRIVLWPLGGIAYVDPPQRAGAMLWSIAAGPLVNVALIPVLWLAWHWSLGSTWMLAHADALTFMHSVVYINAGLLIFNMIPVYPLDGGQILRSLLWFPLGRARSLMTAAIVGLIGVVGLGLIALRMRDLLLGAIAVFILMNCWGGLKRAQALTRLAKLPRHAGFLCPWCHTSPLAGPYWQCRECGQRFNPFESGAACPGCHAAYDPTVCSDCGHPNPMPQWISPLPVKTAAV